MNKLFFKITLLIFVLNLTAFCSKKGNDKKGVVVVYVSEDRVFSEPILKEFEKKTGIKVKAVYDTEETKSTGVTNRLIAEKNNPQCDVYWANEPIRAEVLKQKGVLDVYFSKNAKGIPENFKDKNGYWTGFSARIRVFVVNKKSKKVPSSIFDYVKPEWRGKGVIANPLFGTTTSHIAALFTLLGDKKGRKFLESLKRNNIKISSSNGESADLVASGEYIFSLVDSDDANSRIKQGKPVKIVYPDQGKDDPGCFVIPNTVMLIKGAPHREEAKKLIDFLLSPETEQKLAFADCAQIPLHKGVKIPENLKPIEKLKVMRVDFEKVAKKMIEIQPLLKKFLGL